MKETKFRALTYCVTCGEHGFQFWSWNGQQFVEGGYTCVCDCPVKAEMSGELQQHTGLKDKNCNEIYEGDVLIDDAQRVRVVMFDYAAFKVMWNNDNPTQMNLYPFNKTMEVIGNIHENPELEAAPQKGQDND